MNKQEEIIEKVDFKIVKHDNKSIVFTRNQFSKKKNGKRKKGNKKHKEMRTKSATLHFFALDDYKNLKKIESDMIQKTSITHIRFKTAHKIVLGVKKHIIEFLEI